ncbi:hypothetical protein J7L13_00010 [bacterium]|nr:hypothetical protein [bacterium]
MRLRLRFIEQIGLGVIIPLQVLIFYLWHLGVISKNQEVFNNLGLKEPWFLPLGVLLFVVLNLFLGLFVFRNNLFLRLSCLLFAILLSVLELIVVGYYLMLA